MADVSIVIPFFNLAGYVRATLASVVAAVERSSLAVEAICVDDGSTDGTAAALEGVFGDCGSCDNLEFRMIRKANGGEGSARNMGIAAATGKWVTFLDGDDIWLANHLEVAEALLKRHPDADVIALKYASFEDGKDVPMAPAKIPDAKMFALRRGIASEVLLEVGVFPTFFRRRFLAESGVRFSSLSLGADRLFMAQCLASVETIVKCDAVVHGYRIRVGSMARLAWDVRKVMSQCDYAYGSLRALAASGRTIGRRGHAYLASLWLSDVPNRLLRLPAHERREGARGWLGTLGDPAVVAGLSVANRVRGALHAVGGFSPVSSLRLAWLFRKVGLT